MHIKKSGNETVLKYFGCITLSLVLSLPLYSCSSEQPGQMETPKQQQTSETAASNQPQAGSLVAPSSPPAQGEAAGKGQEEPAKKNLPQVDSAKLQLETKNGVDGFRVIADGSDKDGNPVTLTYEWTKNGASAGEGDTISGFKRGDTLSVKITPFNGKEYGLAKVLGTEVNNTPPKIIEHRELKFDGKDFTYQVKAVDPDGDTLTYSLKQAPEGMVIDKSTGLITWKVDEKTAGKFPATVQVSDGHGGEAVYTFEATIGSEKPQK